MASPCQTAQLDPTPGFSSNATLNTQEMPAYSRALDELLNAALSDREGRGSPNNHHKKRLQQLTFNGHRKIGNLASSRFKETPFSTAFYGTDGLRELFPDAGQAPASATQTPSVPAVDPGSYLLQHHPFRSDCQHHESVSSPYESSTDISIYQDEDSPSDKHQNKDIVSPAHRLHADTPTRFYNGCALKFRSQGVYQLGPSQRNIGSGRGNRVVYVRLKIYHIDMVITSKKSEGQKESARPQTAFSNIIRETCSQSSAA